MKKAFFVITLGIIALTFAQCTKPEQKSTQERATDAVNDAFTVTTNALRNVAEGVNDAVYKK